MKFEVQSPQYQSDKFVACKWAGCTAANLNQGNLFQHLNFHHIMPMPQCTLFRCEYGACSFKTPTKYRLKTHLKAHVDFKPHICTICNVSYKHRQGLNRHLKQHEEQREEDELALLSKSISTQSLSLSPLNEDNGFPPHSTNFEFEYPRSEYRLQVLMSTLNNILLNHS